MVKTITHCGRGNRESMIHMNQVDASLHNTQPFQTHFDALLFQIWSITVRFPCQGGRTICPAQSTCTPRRHDPHEDRKRARMRQEYRPLQIPVQAKPQHIASFCDIARQIEDNTTTSSDVRSTCTYLRYISVCLHWAAKDGCAHQASLASGTGRTELG